MNSCLNNLSYFKTMPSNEETRIKELKAEIEELNDILLDPKLYREAFQASMEGHGENEIFKILKHQIVEYAQENSKFKEFLREELFPEPRSSIGTRSITRSTTLRNPAIFSPRTSSRPILD